MVVYDRLVSDEVMALVRRDAKRASFVGSRRATTACRRRINQLLLEEARRDSGWWLRG